MNYIEFSLPDDPMVNEILTVELAEIGFESFMTEEAGGVKAYLPAVLFDSDLLAQCQLIADKYHVPHFKFKEIVAENWNAVWEKSYAPIVVHDRCVVRASFHPPHPGVLYDLVIEPKMSFGTAHHETTFLMIAAMLGLDLRGKSVVDVGCGTGVLGILGSKLGAAQVVFIDNDPLCIDNTEENCLKNDFVGAEVLLGSFELLQFNAADLILANINRNILGAHMSVLAGALRKEGLLLLSGFFTHDVPFLLGEAEPSGLCLVEQYSKNNWGMLILKKN